MITLLLVTHDEGWRSRITAALPDASVFLARTDAEAAGQLGRIDLDIVVWANGQARSGPLSLLDRARDVLPACVTIAIGGSDDDETRADFALAETCTQRQLEAVMAKALDRRRLLQENSVLRARAHPVPVTDVFDMEGRLAPV